MGDQPWELREEEEAWVGLERIWGFPFEGRGNSSLSLAGLLSGHEKSVLGCLMLWVGGRMSILRFLSQ